MQSFTWQFATINRAAHTVSQDRIGVFLSPDGTALIACVADGAGGMAGGGAAAQRVLDETQRLADSRWPEDPSTWVDWLHSLDRSMAKDPSLGETTVVVLAADSKRVTGASIGDSAAWLVFPNRVVELTESQVRKPLCGRGEAVATGWSAALDNGRLVLATDGLARYTLFDEITAIARTLTPQLAVEAMVARARLQSGRLQDDTAVAMLMVSEPSI